MTSACLLALLGQKVFHFADCQSRKWRTTGNTDTRDPFLNFTTVTDWSIMHDFDVSAPRLNRDTGEVGIVAVISGTQMFTNDS